ncbi:hypothetical protein AB0383_20170 [Amycolatopsis sp. NPDC051373]|uniref:hypothetical protein n=1 Tax=Amycolatopsis sp. NPDC051373 TaxID=3155801 RepID=UPI0034502A44
MTTMKSFHGVAEIASRGNAHAQGIRRGEANNTPEQITAATRTVEAHAVDAGERDELLKMLGLKEPGFRWVEPLSAKGANNRRKIYTSEEKAA